ncbi:helix-turn-helix domain-containing protein [Acuticoccus sp.]|uniref:helix-turn-helix domain-containing protein n=1 Tax=Acuticoccus sp. TaxID=1904378 RepID=UPI003B5226EF
MIEITVAAALNLPVDELGAKTRRAAPVAFARQIAMYCAHVTFGWSLTEAGAVFSRDRTTAAHACRVVEDRRDCPHIDAIITAVEGALESWLSAVEFCRLHGGEQLQ